MATPRRFAFNGATTGPADLLTDLWAAHEGGYAALEVRDTKLEAYLRGGGSLLSFRERLREAEIEAVGVNALEDSTLAAGAAREAVLKKCRTICEWAAALACPFVVAVPSPGLGTSPSRGASANRKEQVRRPCHAGAMERSRRGPRRDRGADASRLREATADALRAMAGIARPFGVRVGFEFLGFATCSVTTLGAAREIVEAVNDPAVGLVLDAFHFYAGGSTWEMVEGLDPARLFLVHLDDAEAGPRERLTDAHRLLPGDGVIPLRDLVRRLDALGYRGVYSIELFRPEYWAWDPVRLAQVARQKMEALF